MSLLTTSLLSLESIIPEAPWSLHQDISIESDHKLAKSIAHLGMMRPPIVKPVDGCYELICGARRFNAFRKLDRSATIGCAIVDNDASQEELLLLIAEDQMLGGPLSPIEAARFIALFNQWCDQPDSELLRHATSTSSTTQRKRLLSLLQLEEPIRTSIHCGKISTKTGLSMVLQTPDERSFVHDLFVRLSLNSNKQRRFLELAQIITAREGCTIRQFISDRFANLCYGEIDNIPQQTQTLMKQIYEHSHPNISLAREEFLNRVAEMNLPKNCRVSPSKSFEIDRVTLEVDYNDFKAFSKSWSQVKQFV